MTAEKMIYFYFIGLSRNALPICQSYFLFRMSDLQEIKEKKGLTALRATGHATANGEEWVAMRRI
jgi:hypothetical protein